MLEYHEQIDNDLMNLITKFRTEIIKENSKNNLIRKNEFFYKNEEYALISVLPNFPHVQLLILYEQGKKIHSGYIVVGNYCLPVNKKILKKEMIVIRKYNGYFLSTKGSSIPSYSTSFSFDILAQIENMSNLFIKFGEYLLKSSNNKKDLINYNIFCKYVDSCRLIEDRRAQFINYKKRLNI